MSYRAIARPSTTSTGMPCLCLFVPCGRAAGADAGRHAVTFPPSQRIPRRRRVLDERDQSHGARRRPRADVFARIVECTRRATTTTAGGRLARRARRRACRAHRLCAWNAPAYTAAARRRRRQCARSPSRQTHVQRNTKTSTSTSTTTTSCPRVPRKGYADACER